MDKPLVSISVVTYNQKDYIKECLDSILMQQTTFPFEIILGEDESTDGTREICKTYAEKYSDKIRLFLRSRKDVIYINGNATGRFNMVENLRACKGKYIAFCDGDDYWIDPLKLQKQVDFLEENEEFGICFHNVAILEQEAGRMVPDYVTREVPEETYVEDLAKGNFIHTPSVLLRNNFELPNWFAAAAMGDWTLYMIQIKNQKIKKLDDEMAVYRIHSEGIWGNKSQEKRNALTQGTIKLIQKNAGLNPSVRKILQSRIGTGKRNKGKSYFKSLFRKLRLLR